MADFPPTEPRRDSPEFNRKDDDGVIIRAALVTWYERRNPGASLPPTVRYIWGTREHFFRHAERGRHERFARERAAGGQPPTQPAARARTKSTRAPENTLVPIAQTTSDLDRLFGPNWRARR